MKQTIWGAVIFIISMDVLACQYGANLEQLENAIENRQKMKKYASEFAQNADRIFLAYLDKKGEKEISFYDVVDLKGVTPQGVTLSYSIPSEITIGCGGEHEFYDLSIPSEGEIGPYLVYSLEGEIIRLNFVGAFAQEPSGHEEIEWLREKKHITNHSRRTP